MPGDATGSVSGWLRWACDAAEQAGAGFDRANACTVDPLDAFRTGTSEPAVARGGDANRPATRGRKSRHRKVVVSRRRRRQLERSSSSSSSLEPSRVRDVVLHGPHKKTCGSRVARKPRRTGGCELVARGSVGPRGARLTTWSVAEIGERHLLRARVTPGGALRKWGALRPLRQPR